MVLSWVKNSPTADQVTDGIDASGLVAFVTGGTRGIGKETVRTLTKRGAHVFIGARNVGLAEKVKEEIVKQTPNAKVDIIQLDTSVLNSVRTAAEKFLALNQPLNILVNNAGIMFHPFQKSEDGVELQFATNYLGHFLLVNLLLDKIKETAKKSGIEGRIISVSSMAHSFPLLSYKEGIRFEKLNEEDGYSKYRAYGQSKLAQIMFTKELSNRLQKEGANVTANVLHPGAVMTNLGNHVGLISLAVKFANYLPLMMTSEQGAATQCYLALSPAVKGVTGKYYCEDRKERQSPSKFAEDEELLQKLWDVSLKLTSS